MQYSHSPGCTQCVLATGVGHGGGACSRFDALRGAADTGNATTTLMTSTTTITIKRETILISSLLKRMISAAPDHGWSGYAAPQLF
jgi:hypothetical protein